MPICKSYVSRKKKVIQLLLGFTSEEMLKIVLHIVSNSQSRINIILQSSQNHVFSGSKHWGPSLFNNVE